MKRLAPLLLASTLPLAAQSTISPALPYAYAANAGWVNFHPSAPDGVAVEESFLAGYAYAANLGWIHFGDGSPNNGYAYSNTLAADCGVNRDTAGNLTGYAWSANTGWINFGWANANDANRPRLDLTTGDFSGYAWSPNLGWIHLGAGYLKASSIRYTDTDGDGMADGWERQQFGSLATATALTDQDLDGSSDVAEYLAGTLPTDAASRFRITVQQPNTQTSTNLLTWTSASGRLYRVEYQDTLSGVWTVSSLGTFAPDSGTTTTRTFNYPSSLRKFFRVVAVKPLTP